jgi:hypothetical protein
LESSVRAPRAAAVAGIVFALLLGTATVLVRLAVPADAADAGDWMLSDAKRGQVELALTLLPFAGISFLWFMGVIRDHLGAREDKFFATVFFGSGVLYVAMLFASAAVVSALLVVHRELDASEDLWRFGRSLSFVLMNGFALRMAAVFTITTTTLAGRLGVLPRWLIVAGYLTALALLFAVTLAPWSSLLFPLWVLTVSVLVLVRSLGSGSGLAAPA